MKYLSKFNTISEYNLAESQLSKPQVAYINNTDVKYLIREHTLIEYLEGNGRQYINTNIFPDANTGIEIVVNPALYNYQNCDDMYLVGVRNNTSDTRWCIGKNGTESANTNEYDMSFYYGQGGFTYIRGFSNETAMYGYKYKIRYNYLNDKKAIVYALTENTILCGSNTVESISVDIDNSSSLSFTPSYPIRIFGSSGVDSNYTKAAAKFYSVKITQGNNLVLDLIPVKKQGVGYMYDTLSGTYYGNNGISSFTCGPAL